MSPQTLEAVLHQGSRSGKTRPAGVAMPRTLSPRRRAALKDWCLARADEWFADGQLGAARDFLLHAAALDPRDPEVWQTLGCVQYLLGEYPRAGMAFVRAGRLRPGDARTFVYLALVHERLGQTTQALVLAEHACQLAPDDTAARLVWERLQRLASRNA
ncbi:hypothetical protein [Limisphaera sp. VF-2]|uniref:hypothetical protein n=1 Tax=Limisphaera sp. VF-2 TaxID=3400418 RepID=UPI00175B44F3